MALIKCPECGREISSFAKACPNCGYPIINDIQERCIFFDFSSISKFGFPIKVEIEGVCKIINIDDVQKPPLYNIYTTKSLLPIDITITSLKDKEWLSDDYISKTITIQTCKKHIVKVLRKAGGPPDDGFYYFDVIVSAID